MPMETSSMLSSVGMLKEVFAETGEKQSPPQQRQQQMPPRQTRGELPE
jgi:hypothetical protein